MTYKQVRDNFVQNLAENAYITMSTAEEMELAISALEKQIPKKIIKETAETYFGDRIYFRCSCCIFLEMSIRNGQLFLGDRYKYCPNCGQALDWSETE